MKKKSNLLLIVLFVITPAAFAAEIVQWDPKVEDYPPPEGNDFVNISAGMGWNLALKSDGSLIAWGDPCYAQDGRLNVPEGNDFMAIGAGYFHGIALKSNGSLVAWGNNDVNQLNVPGGNFIAISAGANHSIALKADHSIVAWGGWPYYDDTNMPIGNDFAVISAGESHDLALKYDGSIVGWGSNQFGECNVPDSNYVKIAAGTGHSLAVKSDGTLAGWGRNQYGQCSVPDGNNFIDVAAGYFWSLALKDDGSVIAWGCDEWGGEPPDNYGLIAIAPVAAYQGSALRGEPNLVLTVNVEPNNLGINTITPAVGQHACYLNQPILISATSFPKCPDVYDFDHWEGEVTEPNSPSTYIIMDANKAVTAVFAVTERQCGDLCHPILKGDLNEDCYINFEDFAIYCADWLACTHPDCD